MEHALPNGSDRDLLDVWPLAWDLVFFPANQIAMTKESPRSGFRRGCTILPSAASPYPFAARRIGRTGSLSDMVSDSNCMDSRERAARFLQSRSIVFIIFASMLLLGQVPPNAAPQSQTTAERYFQLVQDPKILATFQPASRPIEDPPVMPKLPNYLRMEGRWQAGPKCGPVALFFLLRLHGINVELDTLLQEVPITEKGCSLADLQTAAARHGLATRMVKTSPEEHPALPAPHVIHWIVQGSTESADHFDVVIRNLENGGCEIIDTTNCSDQEVSPSNMSQRMSGYALVPDIPRPWWLRFMWAGVLAVAIAIVAVESLLAYRRFAHPRRRGAAIGPTTTANDAPAQED